MDDSLILSNIGSSFCENNSYDEADVERKQQVATSTALVIVDRLKDFHQILLDPPKVKPFQYICSVV